MDNAHMSVSMTQDLWKRFKRWPLGHRNLKLPVLVHPLVTNVKARSLMPCPWLQYHSGSVLPHEAILQSDMTGRNLILLDCVPRMLVDRAVKLAVNDYI